MSEELPKTMGELYDKGFVRQNYARCVPCRAPIEWWWTPNKLLIPLDFMGHEDSPVISHWMHCEKNPNKPQDEERKDEDATPQVS